MRSMAPGGWSDNRWEQSAHFKSIAYVAIHRIAEQMAQAEFQVFQSDPYNPDGKRPVIQGEPAYDLVKLLEKPNNDDSFGALLYQWTLQISLTGMALTWMVPNILGKPCELYPIPTAIAIPQPAVNPDYPDGYYRIQPIYPYGPFSSYPTPASAVGAPIPAQWMLRFKYPHPLLRYEGYSPLSALAFHLDLVESIDRSRWYSMKRSINPSAVLNMDDMEGSPPLPEPEIERIRGEFETAQQGPENAGQLFVSFPGAKLEPWGVRPEEMDYPQGWEQVSSFVLGGLGITKQAAGMIEDSSYSTLFATLKQLYWLTLEPICTRFASYITRHLAPFFGDGLIVEIRCKRIDDHDIKNTKLNLLMAAKAITKNEMRKECDFPLTRELWGNEVAGQEPLIPVGIDPLTGVPIAVEVGMTQAPSPMGIVQQDPIEPSEQEDDMLNLVPAEISRSRPQPGYMGRGAMGERKPKQPITNGSS